MSHPIHIAERGTDLSSRSGGREIREEVERLAITGTVTLDFSGVQSITHSFADELIAVLVQRKGEAWFRDFVRVRNHSPDVRYVLLDALDQRLNATPQAAA